MAESSAGALDGPPAGRVPAGGGHPEQQIGREGEDRLHDALAVGRVAHDECAIVVLERPCDDLRRAGRPPAHQHHDREIGPPLRAVVAPPVIVARCPAPADQNLLPRIEEEIRGRDRLVPQPAGVGTQVEQQEAHALLHQLLDLVFQLLGGVLPNHGHAEIADAVRQQQAGGYGALVNALADQAVAHRLGRAITLNRDVDRRAEPAAHRLDRPIQRPVRGGLPVHLDRAGLRFGCRPVPRASPSSGSPRSPTRSAHPPAGRCRRSLPWSARRGARDPCPTAAPRRDREAASSRPSVALR